VKLVGILEVEIPDSFRKYQQYQTKFFKKSDFYAKPVVKKINFGF